MTQNEMRLAEPAVGRIGRLMRACEGKNALRAFFVVSALESSFLPVPIDLAMIPIGIAQRSRLWLVVLVGAAGSVLGSTIGYLTGALFYATLGKWIVSLYGLEAETLHLRELFLTNGMLALIVAGLSPLPYKLAALLSGSLGMNLAFFISVTFLVRFLRFTFMGLAIFMFGKHLKHAFQAHFGIVGVILLLTMIGGFLITLLFF